MRIIERKKFWALVVLALCTTAGLVEAIQVMAGVAMRGEERLSLAWAVKATMPSWYILGALVPGIIWVARRFRLGPATWARSLPAHVAAALLFAILHLGGTALFAYFLMGYDQVLPGLGRLVSVYFAIDLITYAAVVLAVYAYDYYLKYRAQEREAARLEVRASQLQASLARANLETLRMQLHPHFLFNTLNAISVLAMKGEKRDVARMLNRLSEFLRIALENSDQTVPLRQELEFVRRYLDIEQVRFGERLAVELEADPVTLDAEVPSLILQPLVENAIKHGVARTRGKGRVRVRSQRRNGDLVLEVSDSGPGLPSDFDTRPTGLGLANTHSRLEQLHGHLAGLELENGREGGTIARLVMPFREMTSEEQEDVEVEL